MKRNNGFIATSLLYSFFLVFCALLMALIGSFMHNNLLLNTVTSNIKKELAEVGNKTISSAEIGSHVKIPLFESGVEISTDNIGWVVASKNSTNNTVTLVSDNIVVMTNKYKSITELQTEINRYYNLYTTSSASLNYVTYLTKTQITSFLGQTDLTIKKALMSVGTEYFYYDLSTNRFNLYKYECNTQNVCAASKDQQIALTDTKQYGLRLVMTVPNTMPISTGSGIISDPYMALYYVHRNTGGNILKLHYDSLNHNGNLGFKTSASDITDLSGNNANGILNTGTYTNNLTTGITLAAARSINTNLNIYNIVNSTAGYTIEFRIQNNLQLSSSPNYLNNFILVTNNSSIKLNNSSFSTGKNSGTYVTFSVVRRIGSSYLNVYADGTLISTSVNVTNLQSVANNILSIGGDASNIFKSIRVYNTALTDAEIIHNYKLDTRWRLP